MMLLETSILIVEDHPLFSKALADLVQIQGRYKLVGIVENSADAMDLLRQRKISLMLIDLVLGEEDGIDLIKEIKLFNPDQLMLVISMHDERFFAERTLLAGARGYIMKSENGDEILKAIRTVLAGRVYLSENERERLFESMAGGLLSGGKEKMELLKRLSHRQYQIFSMIGKGLGTIEISQRLKLSTKTVDAHKEHIKIKLSCNTSVELRQLAIELKDVVP